MIKRLFVYIFAFLVIGIDVVGQNTSSTSIQDLLELADQQFDSKQYDELIRTANKAIFDKGVVKDSCFFWLMNYKALAFNYKYQNDSAVAILIKAIDLSENNGNKDKVLRTLYRNYLDISLMYVSNTKANIYNETLYRDYSIRLLQLGPLITITTKDLDRYGEGLTNRLKSLKSRLNKSGNTELALEDALFHEKEMVKGFSNTLFDSYFALVSARVLEKVPDYQKLIGVFESYFEDGYNDDCIRKWLNECYGHHYSLAESYYRKGCVEAAVENYQIALDWYKRGGDDYIIVNGDNNEGNSLDECVLKNIAYLQAAKRFDEVKDYCFEIINNPYFDKISIDTSDYISMITDYKNIVLTIANNPQKKIDPFLFRFDDEIYLNIHNEIDYCIPYIYSTPQYLIYDGKLLSIWEIDDIKMQIEALTSYINNDIPKISQDWLGPNYSDSLMRALPFEERIVYLGKALWEEDGMGFETWISCNRLASLYYMEKDYNNAVRWQQMATNIVEFTIDTSFWCHNEWYWADYNLDNDNIWITHVNVEFFNYHEMAFCYKAAKQFDKSIEYYSKAVNLYLQVLQSIFKGSDMYKEQVWENHKTVLNNIIFEIIGDCDEYPPFGDLVLKLSALQKGFLAWQKIALKDAVSETKDKAIRSLHDKKLNIEKDIELSYYTPLERRERAKLFRELADCDDKLNTQIGSNKILDRSNVKAENIRQSLATNDVYVDFIEIPTGSIVEVHYRDGHTSQIVEKELMAILLKKQWDYPKVVVIGNNFDDEVAGLVTIKQNGFSDTEINDIYLDTNFAHYIWDKIVSKAGLDKSNNVYFVPDGYLHKTAIESLSFDGETRVSDLFNCYRMSSARELLKKKSKISKMDKCLGIGGLQYNKNRSLAIDGQQKKKDSKKPPFYAFNFYKKRNTAPSSMFSRDFLEPLSGSQAELAYLSESFGESVTILNGTIGTENYVLHSINSIKPSILHIGTHGFNCINKNLSTEEERFLIGDRDSYVSPMENSLYRTGLYMSLPQFESSKTASDGIITAKEISMTDLSNTKLVVLSACSTALGNVNSEGVYGLQRGLKLAGAESMLVSLWDVNDKSTELLMKEFYKQLSMGKTRRESLQKAQEAVRNYDEDLDDSDIGEYKTFEAPYYWAGFVLIDGNE